MASLPCYLVVMIVYLHGSGEIAGSRAPQLDRFKLNVLFCFFLKIFVVYIKSLWRGISFVLRYKYEKTIYVYCMHNILTNMSKIWGGYN